MPSSLRCAQAEHSGLFADIDRAAISFREPASRGEVAQTLWNLREK